MNCQYWDGDSLSGMCKSRWKVCAEEQGKATKQGIKRISELEAAKGMSVLNEILGLKAAVARGELSREGERKLIAYCEQLQDELDEAKKNRNAILYRVQYSLEILGTPATLLLIEQALKGGE